MDTLGIDALKTVVDVGLAIVAIGEDLTAPGHKLSLVDLGEAAKLLPVLPSFVQNLSQDIPELKALDADSSAQLIGYVATKLSIADAHAAAVAQQALVTGLKLVQAGLSVKDLISVIKTAPAPATPAAETPAI